MKKNIHLFIRGKKTGPHDMSEVRKLLSSGEISLYDIAEVDGSKILLHNIISLQTEVVVSPPPPQPSELTRVPQVLDSDGPDNQLAKPVSRLVSKTPPPPPLQNQGNSFFCKYCGNQVIAAAVICPSCGAPTGTGVASVPMALNMNTHGYSNQKSRLIYVLLALFLGYLGIHNFYSGHILSGVFKLLLSFLSIFTFGLTILLSIIIQIVEMCAVTQDSSGIPFK
jgi:TM2 domain-containing membrane protein YozV